MQPFTERTPLLTTSKIHHSSLYFHVPRLDLSISTAPECERSTFHLMCGSRPPRSGFVKQVRHYELPRRQTSFTFNAAFKCSAPTSPIWFFCRFSVVSACDTCHRELTADDEERTSHLVHSQCISQMPRTCSTDLVVMQVQCSECL